MACLETMLYFVATSVRSGDSIPLSSLVTSLLPIIVRIQETPNMVDFSVLAKTALAYLKWHPISADDLTDIIDGLIDATREAKSWHTRGAALSFLQVLWYRHFFLLERGGIDAASSLDAAPKAEAEASPRAGVFAASSTHNGAHSRILDTILRLLLDEQLEVRALAASTLAGVFKGMDVSASDALRAKLMDDARTTSLEAVRKRKRARATHTQSSWAPFGSNGEGGPEMLLRTHAAALSLGACIQSSPYEMPGWLPACICLFTDFSTMPSPIRASVEKVLGDFWRTHTDRWHKEKERFTAEQLDILSSCRNSPSYYS